ncbi:DUF1772 domain-containing protein [Spirosoma soli]|uniref:DUF1772 domain-containing protein n=1 Tax=Spirosoma soli TaxID=1770529 RepID=A0ABW5M0V2_9BACT
MDYTNHILLSLLLLNLSVALGAGLYETRIVIPLWFSKLATSVYRVNVDAMRDIDTGRKFWAFTTTIPLTLITLANLVMAWQSNQPMRDWWIAAVVVTCIERVSTFSFFIPTALKLQKADQLSSAQVTRSVSLWIVLNYVRNALTLIAWILALRALSL